MANLAHLQPSQLKPWQTAHHSWTYRTYTFFTARYVSFYSFLLHFNKSVSLRWDSTNSINYTRLNYIPLFASSSVNGHFMLMSVVESSVDANWRTFCVVVMTSRAKSKTSRLKLMEVPLTLIPSPVGPMMGSFEGSNIFNNSVYGTWEKIKYIYRYKYSVNASS